MATNYVQEGDVLNLVAPAGGVASGTGYLIGTIFAVALADAAATYNFPGQVMGVFTLPKTSAQAWTQGQKIYWDDGNSRCDSDSTAGQLIGIATTAAANPSSTGVVRLNGAVPATAEGPQAAEADLTDSTGGAAADGTLADGETAVAVTDNSGGVDPGVDIIAVVTNIDALTDSTGGTADDTVDDVSTAVTGVDGTANNAASKADVDTRLAAINNNFKELTDQLVTQRTANIAMLAAIAQLAAKHNTVVTDIGTQNDNDKDLAVKINAVLAKLRSAGVLSV